VHESNIGKTCGACHPEVMVKGILSGTSLGKLSGHRKGDSSEKFDMNVCIHCHYQDSAHGAKRVYKEFCSRCHDVRSKGNLVMGPTHLNAARWSSLNFIGSGLFFFLLFLSGTIIVYRSRKGIFTIIMTWIESMKMPAAPEEPVPGTEEKEPMKENEKTEP
jgi:hypothetical protein